MPSHRLHHLMQGAWLLSLAALIAKLLSAVYRVPFQNLVGDTGFYVYQQVYPLYGLGMTFALTGFPLFISKLVAEAQTPEAQATIAHRALVLLNWVAGALFVGLMLAAPAIARLMADPALTPLIRVVAVMFLTMPVLATARGYFQGTFDMRQTAVSQVVEQLVRVLVILAAAGVAVAYSWDDYLMGAVAMSGAVVGGVAAIMTLWPAYRQVFAKRRFAPLGLRAYFQLLGRFVHEGGAIALNASMLIVLQLLDSFTVTRGLTAQGVTMAAAKSLKGVYDRGQPLVQLGLVVATALAATLLPGLTSAFAQRQHQRFAVMAARLVRFNLVFGLAATVGLMALLPRLNQLLFSNADGTLVLQVYCVSIAFVAAINAEAAILQSLGRFRGPTLALTVGFLVKLALNQWLVTALGTLGAALGTLLALIAILVVLTLQVPRGVVHRAVAQGFWWRLPFSVVAMGLAVFGLERWWPLGSRLVGLGQVLIEVLVGLVVFALAASLVRLFTPREVLVLPFGKQLLRGLRRLQTK